MKWSMILGSGFVAMMLASGGVMADEEGDQVRTRAETQERVNMQDEGEQTQEQVRNRYEDGEGEQRKEQYNHQHQDRSSRAAGGSTGGGARR